MKHPTAAILIIFISITFHLSVKANPYRDSLEAVLSNKDLSFEDRFETLVDLGFSYYGYDSDELLKHANTALELAAENHDSYRVGMANMLIGIGYIHSAEYGLSSQHFEKSLEIFRELDMPKEIIKVYNNLAIVKQEVGDYEQAIYYLLESLKAAEVLNNPAAYIPAHNNIGLAYQDFEDYDMAMKHYKAADSLAVILKDSSYMKAIRINLIGLNILLDNYDNALSIIEGIHPYIRRTNDLKSETDIFESLCIIYKERKEYQKALEYGEKALKLAEETNSVKEKAIALTNLANVHSEMGNDAVAENYLLENHNSLKDSELPENQLINLESLVSHYKKAGDFEKAFEYNDLYEALNDSLLNHQKAVQIASLESQYENQKKEQTIANLQKDQEISRLNQRFLLMGLVAMLLAGGLFGYMQYNKTRRKNQQIRNEQVLNKQLQELDDMKSTFFANISHEFRTPLTLIKGPVDSLLETEENGETRSALMMIKRNTNKLLKLVNQLLDLSKIEAGKLELSASPQPVTPFIRRMVMLFSSQAERKRIKLEFIEPEDDPTVYFDIEKMEQVVENLLSNAVKWTPEGGRITVKGEKVEQDGQDNFRLSIKDTGPGIPAESLPYIFDRFYQSNSQEQVEGTGIGLSLAKELTELHHGKIMVESKLKAGAEFIVLLPLGRKHLKDSEINLFTTKETIEVPVKDEEKVVPAENDGETAEDKFQVLLVDDNEDVREYVRNILKAQFNVEIAVDGVDAWDKISAGIPDMVVSDVMMPKMNGFELCDKIKTDNRTSHIPVILLTAKAGEEEKIKGLQFKANDYLMKPFNKQELLLKIENLLTIRKQIQSKFARFDFAPEQGELSSLDEVFLKKLKQNLEDHHPNERYGIEEMAREMGMSRSQLHRKVLALTGQVPSMLLRKYRLDKALMMLKKQSGSVSEIAYQVGFSSPAYFSKCFSEEFGYTPKEVVKV